MAEFTFHHGGVSVPSLDEALAWYGEVLGFTLEKRFHVEVARCDIAMLRKGPLRIELFEVEGAGALPEGRRHPVSDMKTHGNLHVAFKVADIDLFMAEMEAKAVDIAFVVNESFGRGCFIRDPAGNLIEFVEELNL